MEKLMATDVPEVRRMLILSKSIGKLEHHIQYIQTIQELQLPGYGLGRTQPHQFVQADQELISAWNVILIQTTRQLNALVLPKLKIQREELKAQLQVPHPSLKEVLETIKEDQKQQLKRWRYRQIAKLLMKQNTEYGPTSGRRVSGENRHCPNPKPSLNLNPNACKHPE